MKWHVRRSLIRLVPCLLMVSGLLAPATGARADEPQAKPADTCRILTHNVWYGFTKKPEPRHEKWLEWVRLQQPDLVSLQELNSYTPAKLAADARQWGHEYSVLLKEDGFATGLTAKTPITDVVRIREGMHHGLMRGRVRGLYVYVIHFHPSNFARRVEEAKILLADIASLPEPNPRIVLAGDFNGFAPADKYRYDADPALEPFFGRLDARSPEARNLNAGRLDYQGIQTIVEAGFVDTVARFRPAPPAFVGTFPTPLVAEEDHGTDRRLDYVFVSPNLADRVRSARVLRDATTDLLSDHYPVVADLTWDE